MTASVEDVTAILARELMDIHGLFDWEWVWTDTNLNEYSGQCFLKYKIITGNREHLLDTAARNIRETILHEIAHALTPDHGHDGVWYSKLKEIGGTGLWVTNDGRVMPVSVDV